MVPGKAGGVVERSRLRAGGALEVAVTHAHAAPSLAEPSRQALRQIDGPVAAAGAADGDGEIAFALALEARQQRVQQPHEIPEEPGKIRVARDIAPDLRIEPGL